MSDDVRTRDDLDAYIATFDEEERQELAHAEAALDLAMLLYHARVARGLTQTAAAAQAGVQQQAISRWENSHQNMQLDTLRRYLGALGYALELVIKDVESGEVMTPVAPAALTTSSATLVPWPEHEAVENAPIASGNSVQYFDNVVKSSPLGPMASQGYGYQTPPVWYDVIATATGSLELYYSSSVPVIAPVLDAGSVWIPNTLDKYSGMTVPSFSQQAVGTSPWMSVQTPGKEQRTQEPEKVA